MNLQPGQIIADKYRIVRQIGQGGMGSVYEGENARIHRKVAIKTLHSQVAGKGDILERFEREAQAAGRIGSEHIVEVLDLGDLPDGSRFMVMEFLEGSTLGERIVKQGRIPPRDLVGILSQLLDGLGAAHAAGIIHRDLKPANVFLLSSRAGRADFVKILDFGVSKFNVMSSDEMSMTRTGAVMGTPYYMSPEQAKGARAIDTRSDLYSIGVIIYEAITGQVPFNAQTFNELIFKIALESPPPPEQFVPNLDPAFGVLMRKAMARDPAERFQTAGELKEAMLAWARDFDARGGAAQANQQPNARLGTQLLPMVTAMQARPPGPAATVFAAPGLPPAAPFGPGPGPGQTQIAHAAPAPARRSALPFVLLGGLALAAAAAGVFFVATRSSGAQAGSNAADTAGASTTTAAPTATATTLAAATASAALAPEPTADAAPSAAPATTTEATTEATTSAKAATTAPPPTGPRPTARPTGVATAPTAPTPTTKPGGRDIQPDL